MPSVQVKVHAPSGTIILNRPERRNALSRDLLHELLQALHDLHQERRVRAVILTGTGTTFCAGMDLAEMQATAREPDAQSQWYNDSVLYSELIETMLRFPKPIIAALNGSAVAGGLGLALACDTVLAAKDIKLGLPEPKRGLVAGIVSPLLAFRVGGGQASHLLMTGRMIDGIEGHRIGIIHELVAGDMTWVRANEIANECAESAPEALQLTKRMLYETIGEHLMVQLSAGAAASATARTTEAAVEGLAAFLEKRAPRWQ